MELNKTRLFTEADLSSASWKLVLNEKSSLLTTFATPFGRFRWFRLLFGLKLPSEIFQKRLIQAPNNLKGVICFADDVLVYGRTPGEHDKHLEDFLERCMPQGIRRSAEKFDRRLTTVASHGHPKGQ